ncbi:unnamed protein product [Amoebophrya sp. A120]|nr:unnamed protein product [Amoebophrya sp. A120]|eukprot:GSA120T00007823001.1
MPAASSSSSSALVPPAGAGGFVPRSVKVKRIAAEDDHESYLKVGDEIRCKNHNGKISKAVVISVNPLTVEVKTNESSYKKMLLDEDEDEEGEFLKMDLLDDVGKDSNSDNDLPGDEGFLEAYGKRKQNNIFQPIRGSKILRDVSKQMTKEKFLKHAAPLQISINGEDFLADAREFNSHEEGRTVGNAGWHGDIPNNEFEVEVAGVKMNAAVNVNIVVYKSYEWKITQESWVELFLRSIPRLKFESGSQEGKGLVWLEPDYSIVAEDHKKLVELMRIHNGGKKFWTATMVANFLQDDAVARIAKANGKPMPQRSHVTSLMTKCGGEKDAKGNWKGVRNNNAPGSSGMQKSLCEMLLQPRLTEAELRRRNEYWESLKKELDDEGHERFGGKSVKKTKKFYWCAKKQELVDDPGRREVDAGGRRRLPGGVIPGGAV